MLFVISLVLQYYYFSKRSTDKRFIDDIKKIDMNDDGVISRKELKFYLSRMEDEKLDKNMTLKDFGRSITGGVIRGFLMGLLLFDWEGGLTLALILGMINPLILASERMLFD